MYLSIVILTFTRIKYIKGTLQRIDWYENVLVKP